MKVLVPRELLTEAVGVASDVVTKKTPLAILLNLYLKAEEDGKVRVIGYNGEFGVIFEIPASVEESGEVAVLADKMWEIVKEMPKGEDIVIEVDKEYNVKISPSGLMDQMGFEIKGLSPESFPELPHTEWGEYIAVNQPDLNSAIEKTIFAISDDASKPVFMGVYFDYTKDKGVLALVATDAKRLALRDGIEVVENVGVDRLSAIVPEKPLKLLQEVLKTEGIVLITVDENRIYFKVDNVTMVANLIEGAFPQYRAVIPQATTKTFKVNSELLQQAIKRVAIMAEKETQKIRLDFSQDGLVVRVANPLLGRAFERVAGEYLGDPITIGMNYEYILDVLKVMDSNEIEIGLNNPTSAVKITGSEDINYVYVAMPMKLTEEEVAS